MNADSKPVVRYLVWLQNQAVMCPVYPFTMLVNLIVFAFLSEEIGFG